MQQDKTIHKLLTDEFDYKACLIWTVIGVIAVFGIVHLGKILFARSEVSSEKYRLSQQVSLLESIQSATITPPQSANTDKFSPKKQTTFRIDEKK